YFFFFSSRRRHTRSKRDWSSDVCSSDLIWFRNTWSWGRDDRRPTIVEDGGRLVAEHWGLGRMVLAGDGDGTPEALFCDNESNREIGRASCRERVEIWVVAVAARRRK